MLSRPKLRWRPRLQGGDPLPGPPSSKGGRWRASRIPRAESRAAPRPRNAPALPPHRSPPRRAPSFTRYVLRRGAACARRGAWHSWIDSAAADGVPAWRRRTSAGRSRTASQIDGECHLRVLKGGGARRVARALQPLVLSWSLRGLVRRERSQDVRSGRSAAGFNSAPLLSDTGCHRLDPDTYVTRGAWPCPWGVGILGSRATASHANKLLASV
jgi:hypothetical protein